MFLGFFMDSEDSDQQVDFESLLAARCLVQ